MSEDYTQRAVEIIKQIKYVTIASVTPDGYPWNSPVYAAFDADLNFYWFSDKDSQHSKNVRASGEAFLVIYDSTIGEGAPAVRGGVYAHVSVKELEDKSEIIAAKAVCNARKGKTDPVEVSKYSGAAQIRGYKATPTKIWMNDIETNPDGSYFKDTRVEIEITTLKAVA